MPYRFLSALLLTVAPFLAATQHDLANVTLHFEAAATAGEFTARGQGFMVRVNRDGLELLSKQKRIPMRWHNANAVPLQPTGKLVGVSNYLIGTNESAWRTGVAHYLRLEAAEVYPGTNLVLYSKGQALEFDFILQSGANPAAIEMEFADASVARINAAGELSMDNVLAWKKPVAYQLEKGLACPVAIHYEARGDGRFGFGIGTYDSTRELVIDPVLTYSTYFGGALADQINAMAVDAAGNVYIAGSTTSSSLPGTVPAAGLGSQDVFIAKLNASGNSVLYSTFIGGSSLDVANGIAVDAAGTAFVVGQTASTNFPVSANAPQQRLNGGSGVTDAFALRLNATGDKLLYSTYFGGPLSDAATSVAIDSLGNAFVAGQTQSLTLPAANNPDLPARGGTDAFLTKIVPSGDSFEFSVFLGGFGFDVANGVAVDSTGAAYVTGETRSPNFPTTEGAFQVTLSGTADAFVSKISNSGTLVFSTYFGGNSTDFARAIAVDRQGSAYITGQTISNNLPISGNPVQASLSVPPDGFVAKFNPSGAGLLYSTYLGGTSEDSPYAIAVDTFNNAHVVGETSSSDFPVLGDAGGRPFEFAGGTDAFVTKLNANGAGLVFSTFIGGKGNDGARAVAVNQGRIFVAGQTSSIDFRTTPGVLSSASYGDTDGFVSRFSELTIAVSPAAVNVGPGERLQFTATVLNTANVGVNWSIFPPVGNINSTGLYTAPSAITLQQVVLVTGISAADPSKSAQALITLVPAISVVVSPSSVILTGGQTQQFSATVTNAANTVTWSISPNFGTISATGLYTAPLVVDTPDTVTVKATSTVDPTRSSTSTVTLAANIPLITAPGIVNAASFGTVSGVSPGLIVTFFGTNMGPAIPATARLNAQGAIDNLLGGTRVLFDGTPSPMIATSTGQVSAVVPYAVAGRATTQVQVEYQGRRSNSVTLFVVNSAPGVFTANASGRGQAAALNENGSLNVAANPAVRGSIMVLFATGEGQTNPNGSDGKLTTTPLPMPQLPVTVSFGGIDGQVVYVGGAPGLTAGLLQVNVRIPTDAQTGTEVPLTVNIGSASSQRLVTVAIR